MQGASSACGFGCRAVLVALASAAEANARTSCGCRARPCPHLGCYGASLQHSNIDRLAAKGRDLLARLVVCAVCAPARTTLIPEWYATSTGAEPYAQPGPLSRGKQMFPNLRAAGYYCTNNVKEDYNLDQTRQSLGTSLRARPLRKGNRQPFFAVFNSVKSHESQIRTPAAQAGSDPAKVRVPASIRTLPKCARTGPILRQSKRADADAGLRLKELEEAGWRTTPSSSLRRPAARCMPRSKRWPYDSGLHVRWCVHIPHKCGNCAGRLPAGRQIGAAGQFRRFRAHSLSLAGIQPPSGCKGMPSWAKFAAPPQPFVLRFSRTDGRRYDMVRSATGWRYVTSGIHAPLIYGQHLRVHVPDADHAGVEKTAREGKLSAGARCSGKTKPPEELYDLQNDRVKSQLGRPLRRTKRYWKSFGSAAGPRPPHRGRGFYPGGRALSPRCRGEPI